MIVARSFSCSAADVISEAEAVLPSTSTATGPRSSIASPVAWKVFLSRSRPSMVTTGPSSWKIEVTSTASSSRPPPLPRRSKINPSAPRFCRSSIFLRSSAWAPRLKVERWT